jgi:hypothetical protein
LSGKVVWTLRSRLEKRQARPLHKGCGVKQQLSMWLALALAVVFGVQCVRCLMLALDEPRTGWKSACYAGAAVSAFVAYSLWQKFASMRNSRHSDD